MRSQVQENAGKVSSVIKHIVCCSVIQSTRHRVLARTINGKILDAHFLTRSQTGRLFINVDFNSLRADFFRENINIYLHFVSFLHIDTTREVEIPPQIRQEPTYFT